MSLCRLNNTLLNQQILEEIKICIETNVNETMITQNLWDSVKVVLRGRFIAIQAYVRKQKKNQINNLTLHLKQLEKEEMRNSRVSRRTEIIKIRAEIHEKGTKETITKPNKTKSCLFEQINKMDKTLARFIKKKREKNQVNKLEMRMEKSQQTTQKCKGS